VPRGLLFAMSVLLLSVLCLLLVAPAVEGSKALGESGSPLVDALVSVHKGNAALIARIVNLAGLVGLGASFFSAMFAYSRQIFALARAGYLPRMLAFTNRHHAPWLAVLLPGGLSYILALTSAGDQLYVLLVFAALVSYLLMFASHIALRIRRPTIHRPYKTPGGLATAVAGSILALVSFVSCFLASPLWSLVGVGLLAAFGVYFFAFARHRVSDKAPEEELAIARAAEESFL
jgi:ethanolamine permease